MKVFGTDTNIGDPSSSKKHFVTIIPVISDSQLLAEIEIPSVIFIDLCFSDQGYFVNHLEPLVSEHHFSSSTEFLSSIIKVPALYYKMHYLQGLYLVCILRQLNSCQSGLSSKQSEYIISYSEACFPHVDLQQLNAAVTIYVQDLKLP